MENFSPVLTRILLIIAWAFFIVSLLFVGLPAVLGLAFIFHSFGGADFANPFLKFLTSGIPLLLLGLALYFVIRKRAISAIVLILLAFIGSWVLIRQFYLMEEGEFSVYQQLKDREWVESDDIRFSNTGIRGYAPTYIPEGYSLRSPKYYEGTIVDEEEKYIYQLLEGMGDLQTLRVESRADLFYADRFCYDLEERTDCMMLAEKTADGKAIIINPGFGRPFGFYTMKENTYVVLRGVGSASEAVKIFNSLQPIN